MGFGMGGLVSWPNRRIVEILDTSINVDGKGQLRSRIFSGRCGAEVDVLDVEIAGSRILNQVYHDYGFK